MKRPSVTPWALLTALVFLAGVAAAGEIYGKVTVNGAAVGEGATVAARCGTKSYPAVKTDRTGTYNLVVSETGKCTLTVTHQGRSATVDVASYEDAAQADIVLELKDGQLTARRR
ncbi:MAG: hypothetical protein ACKO7G_04000 [Gammaproteobacteria bacterium]